MKKSFLISIIISIVVITGVLFLVFKDNNSVKEVIVNMDNITLNVGDKELLKIEIVPHDAVYDGVTYSVSDNTIISVDPSGNVTGNKVGNATIDIIIEDKVLKTINVLVVESEEKNITITNGNFELIEGEEKQLIISKNTGDNIIWECDNDGILSCDNGYVKAIKEGKANVTARCQNEKCSSTIEVTVKKKIEIIPETDIQVNNETINIYIGEKISLNAKVLPPLATYQKINYQSLNNDIVSVDESGIVTGIKEGNAIIELSTTYQKITKKINVLVSKKQEIGSDYPNSIIMNQTNLTINVGEKHVLSVTIEPANAKNKNVNWISSDESIVTVNANGGITGIKVGTATISAITDNKKIAKCRVTVNNTNPIEVLPEKIELNKTSANLEVGETLTLKGTITPSNAKDKTIKWTSSNNSFATVNSDGMVTAKGVGEVTITAETINGKKATCKIVVKKEVVPITKITLNKTSLNLVYNNSVTLTKTVTPTNATENVTWESSNTKIATVDQNGKVTAMGVGTANIIVRSNGGIEAKCVVKVSPYIKEDGYPYRYQDETADLTIEKKTYTSSINGKTTVYYQSHLVLKDYERLYTGITGTGKTSEGKYNTRKISTAAKSVGAIFAVEGDQKANSKKGVIRNGVHYNIKNVNLETIKPSKFAHGCYSKQTGVLNTCKKVSAATMKEGIETREITDTITSFGDLLVDGVNQHDDEESKKNRPRQANFVGYVKPGEFYFIVSEGYAYSEGNLLSDGKSYGFTLYEKGELLKSLGCTYGTQFDGGGSVIVWFRGKQLQSRKEIKTERDFLTDFVYFK